MIALRLPLISQCLSIHWYWRASTSATITMRSSANKTATSTMRIFLWLTTALWFLSTYANAGRPTADTTALRPITPPRTNDLPTIQTLSDADQPTTTATTQKDSIVKKDTDQMKPPSVWSKFQRRSQGPSFDIVPLPRSSRRQRKQKASQETSFKPTKQLQQRQRPPSGTRFDLRPPSAERLSRWFGSVADNTRQKQKRKAATALFNHGMCCSMHGLADVVC